MRKVLAKTDSISRCERSGETPSRIEHQPLFATLLWRLYGLNSTADEAVVDQAEDGSIQTLRPSTEAGRVAGDGGRMARHGVVDPKIRGADCGLCDRTAGLDLGLCARGPFRVRPVRNHLHGRWFGKPPAFADAHRSDCDACLAACSSSPALVPPNVAFSPVLFAATPKRPTFFAEPISLQPRHQPHESRAPPMRS